MGCQVYKRIRLDAFQQVVQNKQTMSLTDRPLFLFPVIFTLPRDPKSFSDWLCLILCIPCHFSPCVVPNKSPSFSPLYSGSIEFFNGKASWPAAQVNTCTASTMTCSLKPISINSTSVTSTLSRKLRQWLNPLASL